MRAWMLKLSPLALALTVAGCATKATQTRPPHVRAPQAPPAVSAALTHQAAGFAGYMRRASQVDAAFANPAAVAEALKVGAAYEPVQLEAGMIAYAAVAALQEPAFVSGVRQAAARPGGRDLAQQILANPDLAVSLAGGPAAAARANGAIHRQGAAVSETGLRVKKAAYSVQRQSWSKTKVSDRGGRLARVKQISSAGYRPAEGDAERMLAALAESGRRGGASPVVSRGVALAALAVLGEESKGRPLMTEPRSAMCLRMAKLNLYQCLASAGPQYEDVFCLGQHALADAGQCVVEAAEVRPLRQAAR
jgi:hypothetical protein